MGIRFYFKKHILEIGVCVGIAIGKVNFVLLIIEGVIPTECEIRFIICAAFAVAILVVLNIITSAMPAYIFFLALSLGVDNDFHSHFIQIVHFILIEDVKLDSVSFVCVWHFEEKPLRVTVGIYIILQQ